MSSNGEHLQQNCGEQFASDAIAAKTTDNSSAFTRNSDI